MTFTTQYTQKTEALSNPTKDEMDAIFQNYNANGFHGNIVLQEATKIIILFTKVETIHP